jgi:hypothetical protein
MNEVRAAVCTMAHGPHVALLDITAPALGRYAERFGYELVELRHRLDPARPASWDKVVLLRALAREFDAILWVDADAIVLDAAPDFTAALRPRRFLHMVEHRLANGRVPNAGVLALRGGPLTVRFLDRVWAQRQFVNDRWWENAAILHLLGYRERDGLRPYVPSPWRLGFGVLDGAWNSIPEAPVPEPFIAHFPGIPLSERIEYLSALAGTGTR